ncbi:MAG: hypothetical protein ACQESK_01715 [Bacteroidota bacterium]
MKNIVILAIFAVALVACDKNSEKSNSSKTEKQTVEGQWVKGDDQKRVEIIEEQFQGFGRAMWEISYRYKELYAAGKDENWGYANHHLEEMEEALELGLQRRPEHASAAEQFLDEAMPQLKKAIETKDKELYFEKYEEMRVSCNACHQLREHQYIQITTPENYESVVKLQ